MRFKPLGTTLLGEDRYYAFNIVPSRMVGEYHYEVIASMAYAFWRNRNAMLNLIPSARYYPATMSPQSLWVRKRACMSKDPANA